MPLYVYPDEDNTKRTAEAFALGCTALVVLLGACFKVMKCLRLLSARPADSIDHEDTTALGQQISDPLPSTADPLVETGLQSPLLSGGGRSYELS
jgi:hypothetical protein